MLGWRNRAGRKSTNRARLIFLFVLIGVAVALSAVLVVISRGPGGCNDITCSRLNSSRPSAQVLLQSSIVNDRKHLFNGVLLYSPLDPMPVEQTQELDVELIGAGKNPQAFLNPYPKVVGSRSLQVGITVAVSRSVTALQPSVVLILMARLDVVTPFRSAGFSGQALRDGRSSDASGRGPDGVAAMLTSGDGRRGGRG